MFRVYIKKRFSPCVLHTDILDCVKVEQQVFTGFAIIRCHCADGSDVEYNGSYELVQVEEVDHAETDN